ncbi:MAG: acid phosphatase [Actinomycetota bacterium]
MFRGFALGAVLASAGLACASNPCSAADLSDVDHIIVIYLENHSFDNLFGSFPNADGLAAAGATKIQVDGDGHPYTFLPPVQRLVKKPDGSKVSETDPRFPSDLPNQPFSIDAFVPIGEATGDLIHRYYDQIEQIDGGRMDKFAAYSDARGLTMGFYDGSQTKLWDYAKRYTLADHFFHAALGGSFLNHFWMVCACTPRYENAPDAIKAKFDAQGHITQLGQTGVLRTDLVTPDGYVVNTIFPQFGPHPENPPSPFDNFLPPIDSKTVPTIGSRLSEKKISWAWYSGGWDDAVAGHPSKEFQFHHQPFAYFDNYEELMRERHLLDARDLTWDIVHDTLPQVVFYKPIGELNEHPGYANVLEGDEHLGKVLQLIEQSPAWSKSIVIVTFDENGGYWDHVLPPKIDQWGPGMRVPTVIISPFAKKGFIDHTVYDTTAILKLIETRFGLEPLSDRDKNSKDMSAAFDFARAPAEHTPNP